ncbi:hypothetical protein [Flavisphingomonas formosensis]|uniref:hypothetical protein n=1 Tax=Flavisphingomonas formosensis TaxID=861534 RepID=UPI0018DFBEBC|nr:hypothetical protein [Sphingomonas formosensis]
MRMARETAANLFSSDGKIPVTILALDADCAIVALAAAPPAGSIAILVRNRVRIFCTVGWTAGSEIGLMFDDRLDGPTMEEFAGGAPLLAPSYEAA